MGLKKLFDNGYKEYKRCAKLAKQILALDGEMSKLSDEELKAKISFDLEISLTNGQAFKADVVLDFPEDGITKNGRVTKEITDLDVAFRRVEN
jgi:preprotein translocase subunit SecA